MKKLRNILLTVLLLFVCTIVVDASSNEYIFLDTATSKPSAIPASFTIGYSNVTGSGNSSAIYYNDTNGTRIRFEPYFKVDRNTQLSVYCIEGNEGNVKIGNTFTYKGMIDDPGLVYLVKNTNAKEKDTKDSYTINQFATWFYMHEVWGNSYSSVKSPRYAAKTGTYVEPYTSMINNAVKIVNNAKNIHNNYTEPKIGDLKINNRNLIEKEGYLISEEISVPLTNIDKYKVSVDKGIVVNSIGEEQYLFNNGEKFRVKVNNIQNLEINVTVEAEYVKEYVTVYNDQTNSKSQDVLSPYIVKITKKVTKSLKLNFEKNNMVEISKVDATNGKELPGATLIIRDSNNKEVDKWVSTNEVHKVKLNPGKYTLEEIIAPNGYILSNEKITFTVKADGTCDKVTMKNEPIKDVLISKVDATNGKELPGATLIIRDSNNKEVAKWVSTNEVHKVKLNPGTYTLEEIIAPNGYILSNEKITFTVKADGTCDKVIMKNDPIKYIEISKVDATNGKELPGATLIIRDSNNKEVDKWVSTNEVHKVKLNPGTYTLEEIIAPNGYILSTEKITFTVKADGTCDKVIMKNEPIKEVEISKVDATNGKELPGATLIIRDSNNKEVDKWVSTNEVHKVKLNPGTYTLEEIIAPNGYILSNEKITFTVKADGTCDKVIMKNEPIKYVEISKVDATNGKELPGATLIIRDSNNEEVAKWVSTNEVHKVTLEPGVYTLEEIIAPKGYELSKEKISFIVNEDGTCDKVVTMKNYPSVPVPSTSLNSSIIPYIIGGVLMIFGGIVTFRYYKKEM